jgi:hypothetical protein
VAEERLLALLPLARRSGESKGLIEVLRSLAEVALRQGNCPAARRYQRECAAHQAESDLPTLSRWLEVALSAADLDAVRFDGTRSGQGE